MGVPRLPVKKIEKKSKNSVDTDAKLVYYSLVSSERAA